MAIFRLLPHRANPSPSRLYWYLSIPEQPRTIDGWSGVLRIMADKLLEVGPSLGSCQPLESLVVPVLRRKVSCLVLHIELR